MKEERNSTSAEKSGSSIPGNGGTGRKLPENMKPLSKFKLIELGICLLAVIFGVIYLASNGGISVGVLLIVYSVCFLLVAVMRILDTKASGASGINSYISVALWSVMAVAIIVITVLYFTKGLGT